METGLTRWKDGYYARPVLGLPDRHEQPRDEENYVGSYGERPKPDDHMPAWTTEELTHWQMYELTFEGAPISPVCGSPDELADWLEKKL